MFRRTRVLDLAELVHLHHAELYRYAYRLTGSAADAEDLTQQVFLIAREKQHQLRLPGAARNWLFTIMWHQFLKMRRRRLPSPASGACLEMDDLPATPEREADVDEERLQRAIDLMPLEYKAVVLMYYFEDLSYKEISRRLQIPMGTVMSRLSRGKEFLRCRLTESSRHEASAAAVAARPSP